VSEIIWLGTQNSEGVGGKSENQSVLNSITCNDLYYYSSEAANGF